MKKKLLLPCLLLLAVALVCPGCKDETPLPSSYLTLDKEQYASLELAQWNASGLSFTQSSYEATVDNNITVPVVAADSALLFAVPVLANGAHSIKITIDGQFYHSYFSVRNAPAGNLNTYFTTIFSEYIVHKNYLTAHTDSLTPGDQALLLNDMQVMQSYIDSASAQLTGLSDTEQQHAADLIQGYRGWINELGVAVDRIIVAETALETATLHEDQKAIAALQGVIDAKNFVNTQSQKMIKLTSVDNLVNTFYAGKGTGAGARAGARIALALLLSELERLNVATRELVEIPLVPFENMFVAGGAPIEFTNGAMGNVAVTLDYRTPYNADQSSSVALMNAFANALTELDAIWDAVMSRFATPLQLSPESIDTVSTYTTQNRQPLSNSLSISEISSSVELDTILRTNGALLVQFSSADTSDISFTFTVTYNSSLGTMSAEGNGVLRD